MLVGLAVLRRQVFRTGAPVASTWDQVAVQATLILPWSRSEMMVAMVPLNRGA